MTDQRNVLVVIREMIDGFRVMRMKPPSEMLFDRDTGMRIVFEMEQTSQLFRSKPHEYPTLFFVNRNERVEYIKLFDITIKWPMRVLLDDEL